MVGAVGKVGEIAGKKKREKVGENGTAGLDLLCYLDNKYCRIEYQKNEC